MASKSNSSSRTGSSQPVEEDLAQKELTLGTDEKHACNMAASQKYPSEPFITAPVDQVGEDNGQGTTKNATTTKDKSHTDSPPPEELRLVAKSGVSTSEITLHGQSHALLPASLPLSTEQKLTVALVLNGKPHASKSLEVGIEDLSEEQKKRRAEDAMSAVRLKEVTIPRLFKVIIPSAAALLMIMDFIIFWCRGTEYSLIGQLTRLLQAHSGTIDWRTIIPALTACTGVGAYAATKYQKRKASQAKKPPPAHEDASQEP